MASLGASLVTEVLGHSAAEKTFRPWWDILEDYLLYGLITLGKLVIIVVSNAAENILISDDTLIRITPDCIIYFRFDHITCCNGRQHTVRLSSVSKT